MGNIAGKGRRNNLGTFHARVGQPPVLIKRSPHVPRPRAADVWNDFYMLEREFARALREIKVATKEGGA